MVGVPAAIPVTIPDAEPMLPCAGLLLLQVPPLLKSNKLKVDPTHTLPVPTIAEGVALTVTGTVV